VGITLFSTCVASAGLPAPVFRNRVRDVARWSERHGCRGILVYTDNSLIDPWLLAQMVIEDTESLIPLVAVQPVYMHPYSVAKMVSSLGHLYDRPVYLNMVAGGFVNDLKALADTTPHDRRYDRLREYTQIINQLLAGEVVTFTGDFYRVERLRLQPTIPAALQPWIFVSASSAAGLATAQALDAVVVRYPSPSDNGAAPQGLRSGIRVGIIARGTDDDAWRAAEARFPEDRRGQLVHELAMRTSDSSWHKTLSHADDEPAPYWLAPFKNGKTFCPYLVGSYERVGQELARYIAAGASTFILDIPQSEDDLAHTQLAFAQATVEVP
jgi:alkanesulfonate monooxygenase